MSSPVKVAIASFRGRFRAIYLNDGAKDLIVERCVFSQSFASDNGGSIYAVAANVNVTKCCCTGAETNGNGGFVYSYSGYENENYIGDVYVDNCVSKEGSAVYQLKGRIYFDSANVTNGRGSFGGYDVEDSNYGATVKYCNFLNFSATKFVCGVEQVINSGINEVKYTTFNDCICNENVYGILLLHSTSSELSYLEFYKNKILDGYLIFQSNVGISTLSFSFFEGNVCQTPLSSNIQESNSLTSPPNFDINLRYGCDFYNELLEQDNVNNNAAYNSFKLLSLILVN